MSRDRFTGQIAGVGTTSGVRIVVGSWRESPLGTFADVMLAEPASQGGTRWLLAPDDAVADYVSATYTFDDVVIGPVTVHEGVRWQVAAPGLDLHLEIGRRTPLGRLLRLVPDPLATAPAFCTVTDQVARVVMRGVRTRGTAGQGRREYYGARDHHAVTAAGGTWRGTPLGDLAPVAPEPRFGFGSTPRRPSVTTLVTTVVT